MSWLLKPFARSTFTSLPVINWPFHHAQIITEEPKNESIALNTSILNLLIMNVLAAPNVGNRWKN